MKKLLYISLIAGHVCAAEPYKTDLDSKKIFYQNQLAKQVGSAGGMMRVHDELLGGEESIENLLAGAIELNDEEINQALVEYLFWKTSWFRADHPLASSDKQLESFRAVENLKPFLLAHLNGKKPHRKVFQSIATIFKDDIQVVDALIRIGQKNDWMLVNVMDAFLAGGMCNESIEALAGKAISSKYATLSYMAALFIKQNPLPSAFPVLLQQLSRPDSEVDFSLAMSMANYVYVEPVFINVSSNVFTEDRVAKHVDEWRTTIIEAILRYDKTVISQHVESIVAINEKVIFGVTGKGAFEILLRVAHGDGGKQK